MCRVAPVHRAGATLERGSAQDVCIIPEATRYSASRVVVRLAVMNVGETTGAVETILGPDTARAMLIADPMSMEG